MKRNHDLVKGTLLVLAVGGLLLVNNQLASGEIGRGVLGTEALAVGMFAVGVVVWLYGTFLIARWVHEEWLGRTSTRKEHEAIRRTGALPPAEGTC